MASKNSSFTNFFSGNEFSQIMDQFQSAPFDLKTFMESNRKNVQAIAEAQQVAIENMQSLAQRQSEIISQLVEDQSALAKEMLGEGSPETKIAKNADLFKKIYERTIKNMHELSDMISKSNTEASNIINKRVSASMGEIKTALDNQKKKAA